MAKICIFDAFNLLDSMDLLQNINYTHIYSTDYIEITHPWIQILQREMMSITFITEFKPYKVMGDKIFKINQINQR